MSLPGPFLAGQRLTAGQLNDATQKTLDSVQVGTAGVVVGGIGATETNVAQMRLGPVDLVAGGLYYFDVSLIFQQTVTTDEFTMRIRRDTALTGTLVSEWGLYVALTTAGTRRSLWKDFTSSVADPAVQFFCSFIRTAGTGTVSIYGSLGSVNKTSVAIRRDGYASEFRTAT